MHVLGANLELHRRPVRADQGRMQRLVAIQLGNCDVVLELARHRLVQRMQGAEREVAIGEGVDHDTETVHIQHL